MKVYGHLLLDDPIRAARAMASTWDGQGRGWRGAISISLQIEALWIKPEPTAAGGR